MRLFSPKASPAPFPTLNPAPPPQGRRSRRGGELPRTLGQLAWTALGLFCLGLLGARDASIAAGELPPLAEPVESNKSEADKTREYQVKAAFLYNFISYTTWPKDSLPSKGQPFKVAVIGPNHFGKGLESLLKQKLAHGYKIETKHYARAPQKIDAHVVFLSEGNAKLRSNVLAALKKQPTLIVGEHPGLARDGAHVNFYLDSGKVRFEVNMEALRFSKLNMSSQLLKLAKIVKK